MVGWAWLVLPILLSVPLPLAAPKDLSGASEGGAGPRRSLGAAGSALRKPKGSKGPPAKGATGANVRRKPPIPRPQAGKRPPGKPQAPKRPPGQFPGRFPGKFPGKSPGTWPGKGGKLSGMGAKIPRSRPSKTSSFGEVKTGKVAPRRWPKPLAAKASPFGTMFGMGTTRKWTASAEERHRQTLAGKTAPTHGRPGKTPPRKTQQKREIINRNIREQKMKEYVQKQVLQFKLADADADKKLTADEALATNASLWERHGRNETLLDWESLLRVRMKRETWFEMADTDKDGVVTFEEFKFKLRQPDKSPPQNLQQRQEAQFKLIDADKDGKITVQEVLVAKSSLNARKAKGKGLMVFERVLLRRMNEHGWMQAVDLDGDGTLVFDEFKLFKKLEPKPQEL